MNDQLAIFGGQPLRNKPFPEWPQFDKSEENALMDVLHSRVWWRTPGKQTKNFEEAFATYHQAKHGIACTNGTAAIEVLLAALEIGLGDEVIVPDFTFVATASAVLFTGAMPVFVDIDPLTYCIDPEQIESAITSRTKAVIAVHLGGHPADMERVRAICHTNELFLIEDSAHAHGSEWNGMKVGALGTGGTFSFQSSKLMTAGEGGIIVTNDDDLAVRIRSVHDCGRMPGEWFYSHFLYGGNYRLSEWQGAILHQQLNRLDEQQKTRTINADILNSALVEIEGITPQTKAAYCTKNGHYCYIFHYSPDAFWGLSTKDFIKALEAEGIPTQASYPPVHLLDIFQNREFLKKLSSDHKIETFNFLHKEFPVTQDAANHTVWLVHRTLLGTEEDTNDIVDAIKKIQKHAKELVTQ